MKALAARRRHPVMIALLLLFGLCAMGSAYAAVAPKAAPISSVAAGDQVAEGKKLFLANCSSCHGKDAEGRKAGVGDAQTGPSLAGVGAASVDFQMGTGRMPMVVPGVQAPRGSEVKYTKEQIAAIGAYVASLAPGPAVPNEAALAGTEGDPARGGELFRVNCAMCHNFAGSGGALTRGKYAPKLQGVQSKHIYEAMVTGPQSMPIFSDDNISPQGKRDIISYLKATEKESPGGLALGSMGPVSEGLFAWIFGLGLMVAAAVWLGSKSA